MAANATVSAEIEQAWTDSQADDQDERHEEGGWIIMDIDTGDLRVVRVPAGEIDGVDAGENPAGEGELACGFFHTHPNPPVDENGLKWMQGPSDGDIALANRHSWPEIIRNAAATVVYGSDRGPYTP